MTSPSKSRPSVLSIAGFDPSGGAGILADIKTYEMHRVYGLGVVTALTFQNESEFEDVLWIKSDEILRQIDVLHKKHTFAYVKIGLIETFDVLEKTIAWIIQYSPESRIIWDPILKASAGFEFHGSLNKGTISNLLNTIFLITPNVEEAMKLTGTNNEMDAAAILSKQCKVYLKGGHSEKQRGRDYLFTDGKLLPFRPKADSTFPKHGSGCVLSSAITANLALGYPLHRACLRAKEYTLKFLMSNTTLSGYHR